MTGFDEGNERYHGNGNPDSKVVALEMSEMKEAISTTGSDKKWWDFRALCVYAFCLSGV